MNGYVCFYNRKRIEVHADSLWDAKKKAQMEFRVSDKKRHRISVTLAEKNCQQITHRPLF